MTQKTLTIRNLRKALFYIDNDQMTVKELRALLFKANEQDKEIEIKAGMFAELEATP